MGYNECIEKRWNVKMKMANIALEIAISAHKGQKDLGGRDYIEHPKAVANLLETDEEKTIGYLHDVLEDTSITEEDLVTMGISSEIVSAIKVLTKKRGEPYTEYIERVKENELARKVKIADLQHNMDLSRIPNPTKRDFERLEKYKKALMYSEIAFAILHYRWLATWVCHIHRQE